MSSHVANDIAIRHDPGNHLLQYAMGADFVFGVSWIGLVDDLGVPLSPAGQRASTTAAAGLRVRLSIPSPRADDSFLG